MTTIYAFLFGGYLAGYVLLVRSLHRDNIRVRWWNYLFGLTYPCVVCGICLAEALMYLDRLLHRKP